MKNLNALHINSYFLTNKIHLNFYNTLAKFRQDKFIIPVYKSFKEKHIEGINIDYIYSGLDKALFFTKVVKVLYLFYNKKFEGNIEYIHAHTLVSDGVPAFVLSLLIQKGYVVTVRGADVHSHIKNSKILRSIAQTVLKKAKIVFFVSPAYRERVIALYPNISKEKFLLLPNGVDDFWIRNIHEKSDFNKDFEVINILFVGRVTKQKNLEILLKYLRMYNDRRYNLNIVGSNDLNWDFAALSQTIKKGNTINYLGEVRDMNKLLKIYRQNDIFIMLSPSETFGVVYVEALTQGLPIIYTKGDGIDGYFNEGEVGYSCDHQSVEDLKSRIDLVFSNYERICQNTKKTVALFEWDYLGKQYIDNINSRF
ncbi:glycosyltransferase family 4 protein [Pontibacter vulgaris]|uniref:glycosyltransferase family 4 protein n=1 Tax=Pontibacter vulgaris TaxID=2905679 RepID=UPI001FA7F585|nr:glycosyltransferase family 4 protein [Pontibacter vulgaris]